MLAAYPARRGAHRERLDPADNRWQQGSVTERLYLTDSNATAQAEWYRMAAELRVRPEQLLPRDLWRWEIALSRVADVRRRTPEPRGTHGAPAARSQ